MKWWKKFLEKLSEANKESFPAGEKLDCCNINESNRQKPKTSK